MSQSLDTNPPPIPKQTSDEPITEHHAGLLDWGDERIDLVNIVVRAELY